MEECFGELQISRSNNWRIVWRSFKDFGQHETSSLFGQTGARDRFGLNAQRKGSGGNPGKHTTGVEPLSADAKHNVEQLLPSSRQAVQKANKRWKSKSTITTICLFVELLSAPVLLHCRSTDKRVFCRRLHAHQETPSSLPCKSLQTKSCYCKIANCTHFTVTLYTAAIVLVKRAVLASSLLSSVPPNQFVWLLARTSP